VSNKEKALAVVAAIAGLFILWRMSMGKVQKFVTDLLSQANAVSKEYNLPVWLIMSQAAHESAYGLSGLTLKAYNLFGFTGEAWKKAGKPVIEMPTTEWKDGKAYKTTRPFRRYTSLGDSMRDYARLMTTQPRYASVVAAARRGDVQAAFDLLTSSGYATDPTYGAKVAGVYKGLKQYLV